MLTKGAGEAALKAAGLSKSIVSVKRKGKSGSGAIKRTGWARSTAVHKGTAEHVDAAHKQDAAALAEDGSQAGQSSASTTDRTASGGNVGLQGGSASGRSGAGSTVASSVRGGAASGSGTAAAGGGGSTSGTSSGAATTTTSDDTTQGSSTTLQALQQQGQAGRTGAAATGQQGEAANQQRRQLLQTGTDAAAQDAAVVTSTAASGDAKGSSTAGGTVAAEGAAAAEGSSSGGVALGSQATLAELNHAGSQADDLTRALEMLGLKSNMGSTVMAVAGAPIARCLRGAMLAAEMSINPNIPDVADECKAEVRSVLIQRASDVRYDPPLLAACARDIVAQCEEVGQDTTRVFGCLKAAKSKLSPLCRAAVSSRQAAAAEDVSLDADLQRDCGKERDELCLDAGWGSGAAQACLMAHLRGSMKQVFSLAVFPATGKTTAALEGDPWAVVNVTELSPACSTALVQRMIEEGEDIRLNYRLSSACAADKQLFCRDVRPGSAAVLRCLDDHSDHPDMQEECRDAVAAWRQLRSLDVRLDHTFVANCDDDVRSLCHEDLYDSMLAGPDVEPFGLSEPFECLRSHLDQVRDPTCRRHLYEGVISAYADNRLDAALMRDCHNEVAVLCAQHPARALDCLQDKIDKFSREDSAAVLKGKISDQCINTVYERQFQAATDIAFVPDLMHACAREHALFCTAPGVQGVRALDCLSDYRTDPDFSSRCATALTEYLAEAARDIRTMAGLQQDCKEEISTMCKGVLPGDGRVIGCLRDQRANITGELCRRQLLRLLGLMVEDHRMDTRLMEACTSDVQKFCAGVEPGDGQVHDCLRRSAEHLSPECRAAEEEVERLEHEDVRLNPKLQRECPLALSSFCDDVPPGDARAISCLQANMHKGHFPAGCRSALQLLTDRAATKYSLNPRLKRECAADTDLLCSEAVDEAGGLVAAMAGTGGAGGGSRQETVLACLARQSSDLAPNCKSELQSLVKLSLSRYRVGMPLTAQCDGDVLARCNVDKLAAPFVEPGYVLGCLAKHAAKLHKPCWELISSMDDGQYRRAAAAETSHWVAGAMDEKVLQKVAADVRRELEPKLYSTVHEQISRGVIVAAKNATAEAEAKVTASVARAWAAQAAAIAPKVNALLHTTVSLLMLTLVALVAAVLAYRKYVQRGGGMLVVRKDGRV